MTPAAHRSADGGFTLIELIVTLTVVAILAVLAVPAFRNLIAQSEMRTASTELALAMTRARSEATKRSLGMKVTSKSNDWAKGWTITDAAGVIVENQNPVKGVMVKGGKAEVEYLSSGRVKGYAMADYRYSLTSTRLSTVVRCVGIDASGGSYIQEKACS